MLTPSPHTPVAAEDFQTRTLEKTTSYVAHAPLSVQNPSSDSKTSVSKIKQATLNDTFPWPVAIVQGIPVTGYPQPQAFFDALFSWVKQYHLQQAQGLTPTPKIMANLNVHAANLAHQQPAFKRFLQQADALFCDGVGIQWASTLLPGPTLPCRLTAGDFLPELLHELSGRGMTAYFLGWQPEVVNRGVEVLTASLASNPVVGYHHGFIHHEDALQKKVLSEIQTLKPDLLFVGFGMPLQEYWIEAHLKELSCAVVLPIGATLDYFSGRVQRAPAWVSAIGMEWFWRLLLEPRRMFRRYVVGNPAFFWRIIIQTLYPSR